MSPLCSVTQLCPTPCGPMDYSLPGSSVHGIFQERILEQVAISSFRGSFWPRGWTYVSRASCIGRQIPYQLSYDESPLRITVSHYRWPRWNLQAPGFPPQTGICDILPCAQLLSHVRLFVTPWTVSCQAPLSMEFSRKEYWSGLQIPTPGDLPNPEMEPISLASPALAGRFFTT